VYGIVHTGGGFVDVWTEVGQGTRFDVYLPAIDKPISAAPVANDQDLPGGHETILVVEDDEMVRTITARMLRNAGYRVLAAANPGEAYLIATEQRAAIDLMLTDVVMPLMNGRALAEKIQREIPALPVIFMSGYTDDDLLRRAVVSDEVRFLQKPVSRATLLRTVRAVLDRSRVRS
jgi:CheY-like chemotaxis protein